MSPYQEFIDQYMSSSDSNQSDGLGEADEDDPELKQDYADFKQWLDKQDGGSSKPAPNVKPPENPRPRAEARWVCQLCKGDATGCPLPLSWINIPPIQSPQCVDPFFVVLICSYSGDCFMYQYLAMVCSGVWGRPFNNPALSPAAAMRQMQRSPCQAESADFGEEGQARAPW